LPGQTETENKQSAYIVGQRCYCLLKNCQWGHSVYSVVGGCIVVVFELFSVVVDWISFWCAFLDEI